MPKKICIVDDQPALRQMVRFALSLNGLEVVEAENGEDALRQITDYPIDLVILDWCMPKMGGLQFLTHLRHTAEHKDLPVIVVSSKDDMEARKRARSLGVLTWMRKPFRISEIQTLVESTLGIK